MNGVLSMALPFFGLILLGFACGKLRRIPAEGLAWLNFFIIYLALPALFYQLMAKTPFEQLSNWPYVLTTTLATCSAFALSFAVGVLLGGRVPQATMQALLGSYSNVGYMGPGLTLAAFGPPAAVPTALIFCFDNALLFTLVPLLMAVAGPVKQSPARTALNVLKRVALHPFILATAAGVLAAYVGFEPPAALEQMLTFLRGAAAPCALFTLGVTVALRPWTGISLDLPLLLAIKLVIHPALVCGLLIHIGGFDPVWIRTAVLMAALPPALNVFVLAQQYGSYVQGASNGVLLGTLVSVATVTGLLVLITKGWLPGDPFAGR